MHSYSKPIPGLSTLRSERLVVLLHEYQDDLTRTGYNPIVARLHLHSVVHFAIWIERRGIDVGKVDQETVAAFERHRAGCRCSMASQNRGRHVASCVRVFLRYLRKRGCVAAVEAPRPIPIVGEFLRWMSADRGVCEVTLASYRRYVTSLVEFLGDTPQTYTAAGLRHFLAKRYRHSARGSVRMVLAAVRMFLRYLAVDGRCRVGLDQALISPPNWSLQSLPRGLSAQDVDHVLRLCRTTPAGLRDRAILLLLSRLGLRAGDVAALRFTDLCFETGTLRVCGKGGREVRLPLPQEVGDALLDYLRRGRPRVMSEYVFLRAVAPFQTFAKHQPGHAITHVARAALKRAGIQPPKSGAHVFRHTAACEMLRAGVGLEGIAAVLRHRSVETTALYAKVDLQMLAQVVQPWPGVAPC